MATQEKEYIARLFLDRLDSIQQTLIEILDVLKTLVDKNTNIMNFLISSGLPTGMLSTVEVAITPTPVLLIKNDSLPLMRIRITNDDAAQPLWVGTNNVSSLNGEVIYAGQFRDFVITQGMSIFGVCVVASIVARLSNLADPLGELKAQGLV